MMSISNDSPEHEGWAGPAIHLIWECRQLLDHSDGACQWHVTGRCGTLCSKTRKDAFFFPLWSPGLSTFLLILPWAQRHSLGCADCSIPGPVHIWPSPLLCLDPDPHWAKGSSEGLSWGLKPLANASHQLSLSKHKFKDKLLRIWGMQWEGVKSQGRACFRLWGPSSAHQPLAASVPGKSVRGPLSWHLWACWQSLTFLPLVAFPHLCFHLHRVFSLCARLCSNFLFLQGHHSHWVRDPPHSPLEPYLN